MFSEFEFGAGLFGDGAGVPVPPTPTPATFQRLKVECKTLTCTGVPDTSLYSIQDPIPSRIVAAAECKTNDCTGIAADSQSYSLQDALLFNGTPVTVPVTCPPGANCIPGSFPPTVTYPPGTFVFPDVPLNPGEPINLCLDGCQSTVCRLLPAGSSQAEIQAAANAIILEVATQQAQCDSFPNFPFGTTVELTDLSDYACLAGSFADAIDAIITPASYPATFNIIGGALPIGITMSQNGTTAFFTGTPTTAGSSTFTLRATSANGVSATRAYTIEVVGITTSSPLPDATIGEPYSETLAAVGISAPLWGIGSGILPAGLAINTSTGEISGTPTETGSFAVVIFVQNSDRQCAKAFTIEVGECLITTASPLPEATSGEAYSTTITATDITGTMTWSVIAGALPAGLSLNTATGEVSGIPAAEETANFTIQVTNATGNICSKDFVLDVGVCLITTASPLPAGTDGVVYSQTLAASDITGTLTWSIISGALPAGLSLNAATGEISGTPTTVETASFTAQVVNGLGNICSKAFSLEIEASNPCGATPAAIEDMVWADDSPVCGVMTMVGDSGSYSTTLDFGACNAGIASASGAICNPGAPYLATFMFTYTVGGNHLGIGANQLLYELFVNGNPSGSFSIVPGPASGSSGSTSFNYSIPTGSMIFQVRVANQLFPNPSSSISGSVTITPATPP